MCVYFSVFGLVLHQRHQLIRERRSQLVVRISPLSFGAVGAMINFAVAFIVSYATKAPPQHVQDLVESVRYPRGSGTAIDH